MAFVKVCALLAFATVACASPAFWKGTALDSTVEEMRSLCANDDAIACLKFRAMSFLDTIFKKDNYQVRVAQPSNFLVYRSLVAAE